MMRKQGTTLLFVSHSIDSVKEVCDHALWLRKGVEVQSGLVNEVCDAYMESLEK